MNIFNKYYLGDFTLLNYIKLLKLAAKKYKFRSYKNFKKTENFIIWRHDIDVSVTHAKVIAEIEAGENVYSTYFLLLHSEMYNLLEKAESEPVKSIISLGHDIGLHFDPTYYEINSEKDLEKYLLLEKEFMEKVFKIKITAFAFHNPTPGIMKFNEWKYAGMINTYADYFRKNTEYCSDSNGYWRFNRLENVLKQGRHKAMHVLTHPVFWQKQAGYPKHKIWNSIMERADNTLKLYDSMRVDFGRENVQEHKTIFDFLKSLDNKYGFIIEKNWIKKEYSTAFLHLWLLHHKLVNSFLKRYLEIELNQSKQHAEYFYKKSLKIDLYKRFELVTGLSFIKTFGIKYNEYKTLISVHEDILNAAGKYSSAAVKNSFVSLAEFLIKLETIIRN